VSKPILKVKKDKARAKREQRQAKLAALAEKKAKSKLTLEDIDEKLDVIIEMLEELMPPK